MTIYKMGYDYYVLKCVEFGVDPINFYYYCSLLSKEQLDHYNQQAQIVKGS
ncbi:transcriptional regulator [Ureibacillus sp. MALMAid1270]|uniref:transcriptional regulator n=1 Tax=Ureibacillus sp. MALMAid1270 TaxID=3411629 RepID=UPI003BA6F818